jgi:hypothetical protein
MTSQNAQEQEERDNPFAYLYPYEFILLTTLGASYGESSHE